MVAIETTQGLMAMEMIHEIPTGDINPHPANRDEFDEQKTSDMEDSLRANGQLTPALLRPLSEGEYQLIAGERRWRGCVAVGIPTLRAVIRNYSDEQALEILIWENLERENLSELQEARLYQALMDMKDADGRNVYTLERIAEKRFGDVRKLSRVAQILKLNALPEVMKKALKAGTIKTRHAFLVARIAEPKMREQAAKEVLNDPYGSGPMTVERAGRHIMDNFQVSLKGAKFDKESSTILSEEVKLKLGFTGAHGQKNDSSCERCPWLAKNNPAFEGELAVKSKDGKSQPGIDPQTCTFAGCYQAKMEALWMLDALPFAQKHGVPEGSIRARKDGGDRFVDYHDGRLFITGRLNDTRVLVEEKVRSYQIDMKSEDMPAKVPTWREVIKGAEVPMEVIAGPKGEPILIADKALAIMAGKQSRPELFAAAKTGLAKKDMNAAELAAQQTAERQAADMLKRETAISTGTRAATVRELMDKIREKGAGVGMLQCLIRATMESVNDPEMCLEFWFGRKMTEWDDLTHEELAEQWMTGLGMNDLWALLTLMTVGDDLSYSWHTSSGCRDFDALCEEYGVERKEVKARVTKEYDAAAKLAAAEAAAKGKPKMKSKGKDKDGCRETELANEELVKAEILAKGDEERLQAPSHETKVETAWARLVAMEPVESEANEHDVFETYSRCALSAGKGKGEVVICLAKRDDEYSASFEWDDPKSKSKQSGGANPNAADLMPTKVQALLVALGDALEVCSASPTMAKVAKIVEETIEEGEEALKGLLTPALTAAQIEDGRLWKQKNPDGSAGMMAEALGISIDQAFEIIDGMIDEKHDKISAEKAKAVAEEIVAEAKAFEDQVKAVANGAKPSEFIGLKPSPTKEPKAYKEWNAKRMQLERAAKKLKQAA